MQRQIPRHTIMFFIMNTFFRYIILKYKDVRDFFSNHKTLTILTILAVCCMSLLEQDYSNIFVNVSYSLVAAAIFYVVIDYLPLIRKKKMVRTLIDVKISKLCEYIRLCKNTISNPFDFNSKEYKNSEEYADAFEALDLTEKWGIDSNASQTRKSHLDFYKKEMLECIISLLNYSEFLSEIQLNNLILIKSSVFLTQPICEINRNIPKDMIYSYPNNQRDIGESIYKIDELMKEIKACGL